MLCFETLRICTDAAPSARDRHPSSIVTGHDPQMLTVVRSADWDTSIAALSLVTI